MSFVSLNSSNATGILKALTNPPFNVSEDSMNDISSWNDGYESSVVSNETDNGWVDLFKLYEIEELLKPKNLSLIHI